MGDTRALVVPPDQSRDVGNGRENVDIIDNVAPYVHSSERSNDVANPS
jgi:hypothetical protein